MTKKCQKFGWKKDIFGIILKKRSQEKNFRWKIVNFLGKCLKIGHRKFGILGNVILQKSPAHIHNLFTNQINSKQYVFLNLSDLIFSHSFILDISIAPLQVHYYSKVLPTTALILCRSQHGEALQATVSEGLAQGLYMAARVGFEPATLRTQSTELTTEPPCPTHVVEQQWDCTE